jgi:Fic family protein
MVMTARQPSPTHPWIDFNLRIDDLPSTTWFFMGEAMSKCAHLIGSPLRPSVAEDLAAVYLAKGVHATTAIEGNTLTEEEVLERVKGAASDLPTSREYLGIEADNIIAAVAEIDDALRSGVVLPLDTDRLKQLHAQVLRGLDDPPENDPGRVRRHNVAVARYSAPDHTQVEDLLSSLFEWLNELRTPVGASPSDRFASTILRAILAHLYIAWIHPFGNGNGRTARLVEVQILAQSGLVPLLSTNLLSDYYNKTREMYYRELEKASRTVDPVGFVAYAVRGFVEELRAQVKVVKDHNVRVAWESFIHETLNQFKPSDAKSRQRRVALEMPSDRFITTEELVMLTPPIAADYARTGERTPARDLNDLVRMGLLEKKGRSYRARLELIQAFSSPVAPSPEEAPASGPATEPPSATPSLLDLLEATGRADSSSLT